MGECVRENWSMKPTDSMPGYTLLRIWTTCYVHGWLCVWMVVFVEYLEGNGYQVTNF